MKRLPLHLIFVCIILISVIACKDKPSTIDDKDFDGFRGIKWGTNLSSLEQMTCKNESPVPEDKAYCICTRQDDILALGGAKLESIIYHFLKDELLRVYIRADSNNANALKRILIEKLGPPTVSDEKYNSKMYVWQRPMTETFLTIESDKMSIIISDINAHQKEEDYKNQIAKNGAERGF